MRLIAELDAEACRHVDNAERSIPHDVAVTKLLARESTAQAIHAHTRRGPWDLVIVGEPRRLGRRLSDGMRTSG